MGKLVYKRADRLATTLKRELSTMINSRQLREFKDPDFAGLISITDMVLEGNYQHANVYISVFEENKRLNVMRILDKAIPALRGELCRRCQLRFAPTLAFHLDESLARASRVLAKLHTLNDEIS